MGSGRTAQGATRFPFRKAVALSANRRNTGDAPARRHCLFGFEAAEEDVLDVLFVLADVLDDVRVR